MNIAPSTRPYTSVNVPAMVQTKPATMISQPVVLFSANSTPSDKPQGFLGKIKQLFNAFVSFLGKLLPSWLKSKPAEKAPATPSAHPINPAKTPSGSTSAVPSIIHNDDVYDSNTMDPSNPGYHDPSNPNNPFNHHQVYDPYTMDPSNPGYFDPSNPHNPANLY